MKIRKYLKMLYLKKIKKDFLIPFEIKCPYCPIIHTISDTPRKLKWDRGEIECGCGQLITFYNKLELIQGGEY